MAISTPEDISDYLGWGQVDIAGHVTLDGSSLVQDFGKPSLTVVVNQAGGSDAPARTGTINGEDAITWDGTDWMPDWSYTPAAQPFTMCVMLQMTSTAGYQTVAGVSAGSNLLCIDGTLYLNAGSGSLTTSIDTSPHAIVAVFDGASSELWVDGVLAASGSNPGTAAMSLVSLGGPDGKPTMRVTRWSYYGKALDSTEAVDWSDWAAGGGGGGPSEGEATGAVSWVGSATGARQSAGAASGAVGWAGSATGARQSAGAGAGAVGWVGSATGARQSAGAGSGAVAWVGTVTGEAPTVGGASGSADGAITWAGSATGSAPTKGDATGAIAWVGSATGARPSAGAATGAVDWVGTVTGEAPVVGGASGAANGAIGWAGTVTGARTSSGEATGAVAWNGTSTGEAPTIDDREGVATGTVTWAGTVTGARSSSGAGAGAVLWGPAVVRGQWYPGTPLEIVGPLDLRYLDPELTLRYLTEA